jgi:hypothetical protein
MSKNIIDEYFKKNTKFRTDEHFNDLKEYVKNLEKSKNEINFGTKYKFIYYEYSITNARPENLFKLQWIQIITAIRKYFPDITYKLHFEQYNKLSSDLLTLDATYKHDVYIQILYDNRLFDIAIEFDEPKHPKQHDDDRRILTTVLTDKYLVHKQNDDLYNFMKSTIYLILQYTCALTNDIYNIVRINFFKDFKKSNIKQYEESLDIIIELNTSPVYDFANIKKKFYITNSDGDQFDTIQDLVDYLQDEYDIILNFTSSDTWDCDTESIILLLDSLPKNMNEVIDKYKEINRRVMKMYIESQNEIINLINEKNENTKNLIPSFINNFIKMHISNYNKPENLKVGLNLIIDKTNNKQIKNIKHPVEKYVYNEYIIHLLKNKKLI